MKAKKALEINRLNSLPLLKILINRFPSAVALGRALSIRHVPLASALLLARGSVCPLS